MIWIFALFNAEARAMKGLVGVKQTYDTTPTKDVLGINFRSLETSVCEMSETLIKTGFVPKPKDG